MSELNFGVLIEGEAQKDAVHVAVAPVIAGEKLSPADHVGFLPDGRVGEVDHTVGIVDPYLRRAVKPGDKFWLLLYPKTVTGMRHEWSHPSFTAAPPPSDKAESEKWLREAKR